jgi:tetratricopeptide (TPR) repeat protein
MAKRYFNWKLAIVLVISIVVLGATAYALRQWQRSQRAEHGLDAGLEAYNQQHWEEAAAQLGRYLAVTQDDVPTLLKYADAQLNIRPLKRGSIGQAVSAYRTVLRIDPNNSEAAKRLTEVYLSMGTPGEAELIAARFLETNQNSEIRRLLALAFVGQRKYSEAAAELRAVIQEYPEQILAYETLAQLTEQRPDDFPGSPDYWFNQAVENNPSSALAYIIRAGFHLRNKDNLKALSDLEQAEKLDLSEPTVRLRLAQEFINVDVLDKAEEHLMTVQKTKPTDQNLWQMWVRLALKSQSQEKMLTVAETGLKELSSQPWEFIPQACELFIRAGQLDRATDCITRLREKDIFPEIVAFMEGLIAEQRGQYFEAVKCWRRSIELGNQSPQIRLALASDLSRLGDRQSALQQLRLLVSERPNFFDGRIALVRLLAQTGNWAEVAEHASTAMRLSPESLEAALTYLQARMQLVATRSPDENIQIWQDIEEQLTTLEKATDDTFGVKLLQFQLAMQRSDFGSAETLLIQLKKDRSSEIRVAMAEADLLIAQKKEDEAIIKLTQTIKEFPEAVEPVTYLAVLLSRQDDREKSEAIIKEALTRVKQQVAQRNLGLLLANLYTQWGQADNAYKFLNKFALELPNDIPIKRRLLTCEQVIGNSEQAQRLINDIQSLEDENGWQWRYEQARVWFVADDFKNRYPQIVSLLRENVLANPDDQASRRLLAATYDRGGELQLAISTYRDALSRTPDDLRVIVPTIAVLYKARQYAEAEKILNRASQSNLYHPDLQRLQLQNYLRRGEISSASDILEDLLRNDPNNQAIYLSLASLKMQQDEFEEAAKLLDRLEVQDPNSMAVANAKIQLNIRQGKNKEALKLCDEIVNRLNNASAYILRARTYFILGQYDKALDDLEYAASIEPNNSGVWVAKSDFHRAIGQLNNANLSIEQALSLDPNSPAIQKRAISLFLTSVDPDRIRQGRRLLDGVLQSNPQDVDLRLLKAQSVLAEGTASANEEAQKILEKITQDQPNISEPWVLLGEILLRQGQPGRAVDTALRGLVHNSDDRGLLLLKARAEAARSPVLAVPTLKLLLEQDPNDLTAILRLANTYIAADEPEKAVALLEKESPTWEDPIQRRSADITLAVGLYRSGNKAEAQKKFDALIQSEPNDPAPLLTQIQLLRDDQLWDKLKQDVTDWYQNHIDDNNTPVIAANALVSIDDSQAKQIAEEMLRMVLERAPKNLPAINTLAILLQTTEHFEESARLYQKILQLQPDNVIAMNNLAWIMCEEQGKPREALELAQAGLQIAPNYIDLIDTRGVIYHKLGEFDKAVEDFNTAIKLYPKQNPAAVTARFHLGRSLAAKGQSKKAADELQQALNLHGQIGGLSELDIAEAQRLLEKLQKSK